MGRVLDGVHRAYIDQGASRVDVPAPSLRQLVAIPPDWVEHYLDLIKRLRANPAIARQLPQTIELACFDALLYDTAYQAAAFDHLFTTEHRSLLLTCVRMLGHVAGEHLADALTPITELDYRRSAPALPDRTAVQRCSSTSWAAPWGEQRVDVFVDHWALPAVYQARTSERPRGRRRLDRRLTSGLSLRSVGRTDRLRLPLSSYRMHTRTLRCGTQRFQNIQCSSIDRPACE